MKKKYRTKISTVPVGGSVLITLSEHQRQSYNFGNDWKLVCVCVHACTSGFSYVLNIRLNKCEIPLIQSFMWRVITSAPVLAPAAFQ